MTALRIPLLRLKLERPGVLPGFGPALGFTLLYLSLVVLIPLAGVFFRAAGLTWDEFLAKAFSERALAAYRLSFGGALAAATINAFAGVLIAWVLVRYRFPGKKLIDATVDLPFALPTAVAGIALTAIYAPNGWIGAWLEPLGIKVAFTPIGVIVAMVFIGLPFVVRTVQPVLQDFEAEVEEAAHSLGARRIQIFLRVILPGLLPAVLTGYALAFARALGEYGSVIFIAGNMPGLSEIAPLLIIIQLEQYDYAAATAIAAVMLVASFLLLILINSLQVWRRARLGG
ncbi:sulfate ABC transporter permease [Iodidimonas gelatinilytica]|uniref:Sulfate transport system permease protein CysT n=1 Tax=Iodidimonas gelatinilytica TaxID=1236966 RepID=A0A5A7MTT7_9PROT|nr:sulfate ABC transporter permease subunit CysT [Iodidimonas gelatinilytica]GEQ99226.1 sulfate ABC transporter permease [Iodidimonas gelatinilytica]